MSTENIVVNNCQHFYDIVRL